VSAAQQPVPDDRLDAFDRHRRLLFTVAYQMLGSVADAEDVVQDAWLRWSAADRDDVGDPKAYLVRITSRLALDRLGAARTRRETYVGPWLPEPLLTDAASADPDPAEAAEIGEQVSLALLVVLETLSPLERAVFVLREVFGMPAGEVAAVLDRSEAAVRQVAHRARQHVEARRPRFDADRSTQRAVTERFFAAVAGGDVDELMAVLSPGVVLVSDGGGQASAALRPVTGADKVARFLVGIAAKGQRDFPDLRIELADVNGTPSLVGWIGQEPFGVMSLGVVEGRVDEVFVMVNPQKLTGLALGT
jgi:RNA polymerase sigma-70 factor (ECF subfamily)